MTYPHPKVPYQGLWFAEDLRQARLRIFDKRDMFICTALEGRSAKAIGEALGGYHTYDHWMEVHYPELKLAYLYFAMRLARLYWIDTMIEENEACTTT